MAPRFSVLSALPRRLIGVLFALQAALAGAAEDFSVDVERSEASFRVNATASLAASGMQAWEVLTDYAGLPRFIPGIASSTVHLRAGSRVLVEQKGEARFLIFSYPIDVRLEITESPYDWISSRGVGGTLRRMSGRYDLQVSGGRTMLRYSGELEPDFSLPPLVGTLAVRSMVEEQFAAMVAEIERRAAAATRAK